MITWSGGQLEFANGAYLGSPMPKIYLNGEIAFCGEWNGETPAGDYIQSGQGNDSTIKQILANYDKSGKSNADYAAAQAAIWAHIMGTSVSSWEAAPAHLPRMKSLMETPMPATSSTTISPGSAAPRI